MKVLMVPHLNNVVQGESGIHTLVRKYFEYLPQYGIELVDPKAESFDILAIHAGMTNQVPAGAPIVAHLHGLYWTGDLVNESWQHGANRNVVDSIIHATVVTVPSSWVSETLRRDMHLRPFVLPHAIDAEEWKDNGNNGYVLWNKNRASDVCSPEAMNRLAKMRPGVRFASTYSDDKYRSLNIEVTGIVPHPTMKKLVQNCGVYLSTAKETWGIGIIEAMAAGKPVLGFDEGNIRTLVEHGVNGYLARPGDMLSLANGLDYCMEHYATLGANSRYFAEQYSWHHVMTQLVSIYDIALDRFLWADDTTVVIPCYNKGETLERAVKSALSQTKSPFEIIIVDNNSTDNSGDVGRRLANEYKIVTFIEEHTQGVAHARNAGCHLATTKFVCCLDGDDEIAPQFLEVCTRGLVEDRSLGLTFTKLLAINDAEGIEWESEWPDGYEFDRFLKKQNQVPTCCVFRKDLFERLGGFRQRYAPHGAGSEDAEFWMRMGALGYPGKMAGREPLFRYHLGGATSKPGYQEVDYRTWHPYAADAKHPFASPASPHNGIAHPVYQYDKPIVSVVIPVGPNHEHLVIDALDSLEAQGFRKWEAILVFDNGGDGMQRIETEYPFVRCLRTGERGSGAGHARNLGAEIARGRYLLFLDADDWLAPEALYEMLQVRATNADAIVYSDYIGHAYIENQQALDKLEFQGRLLGHDSETSKTAIAYNAYDYDCEKAMQQPRIMQDNQFYIWCLISSLVPKAWHDEIGGFDEEMDSWEDWDYWIRMAHKGHCFERVKRPLVYYRFFTGMRRALANPGESGESGRQLSQNLLKYLEDKYQGANKMPCGGCRKSSSTPRAASAQAVASLSNSLNTGAVANVNADEMVWVQLNDGNVGDHPVSLRGTNYGYKRHGDQFKMLRGHAESMSSYVLILDVSPLEKVTEFAEAEAEPEKIIPDAPQMVEKPPPESVEAIFQSIQQRADAEEKDKPVPEKVYLEEGPGVVPPPTITVDEEAGVAEVFSNQPVEPDDLHKVWGVKEEQIVILSAIGVRTYEGLLTLTAEQLEELLEVAPNIASRIWNSAKELAQ
jgi:glycosyltransferase involved in cell wall biosynthesis